MRQPLSSKKYKAALAHFNLTQAKACWLFGGKSQTSGRLWASDGCPFYVALILAMMWKYKITPDEIEELGRPWRRKKIR